MTQRDFQIDLQELVHMIECARLWAKRAVAFDESGERVRALAAQRQALVWLKRASVIEKAYKRKNPHD